MFMYLASASPRRRELLQQIGAPFEVIRVSVDETGLPHESPLAYVQRLAQTKALAGQAALRVQGKSEQPVMGADTIGVLDGRILLKPADETEAVSMLTRMGGRVHQVITAVALTSLDGLLQVHTSTDVHFRNISILEAQRYWRTGEPRDKAGAYGIQGLGAVFVERIEGSYSGVVGLPLFETAQLLEQAGVRLWSKQSGMEQHE